MQLRQTKAVGVFYHHERRVGHIHANLDNRRAHQHLDFAVDKVLHNRVLLRPAQPAMQKRAGNPLQKVAAQLLIHLLRTARLQCLRLLD